MKKTCDERWDTPQKFARETAELFSIYCVCVCVYYVCVFVYKYVWFLFMQFHLNKSDIQYGCISFTGFVGKRI